jgi:hypothetical protein
LDVAGHSWDLTEAFARLSDEYADVARLTM